MIVTIVGERHKHHADLQFLEQLTKRAENGEIILIREGLDFGDKLHQNILGIEDPLIFHCASFIMAYNKSICCSLPEEDATKLTQVATLSLEFKQNYVTNWYIKVIMSFFISTTKNNNQQFLDILQNVSTQLKEIHPSIYNIFNNFVHDIENMPLALTKQRIDLWDNAQDFTEHFKKHFVTNWNEWTIIIKTFIRFFITVINKSCNTEIISNNYLSELFKDKPTYKEICKIVNEISEVITVNMRNQIYAKNLLNLAFTNTQNKPIYFVVGDKHVQGLKEILEVQRLPFEVRAYRVPDKPFEFLLPKLADHSFLSDAHVNANLPKKRVIKKLVRNEPSITEDSGSTATIKPNRR